jgi:hypothetical protein
MKKYGSRVSNMENRGLPSRDAFRFHKRDIGDRVMGLKTSHFVMKKSCFLIKEYGAIVV